MTLQDKVEATLKDHPETRNSDDQLTLRIIYDYYNETNKEMLKIDDKWYISVEVFKECGRDDVKRYRALLNHKGLYLPTDERVIKARRLKEVDKHNEFSISNPSKG